MLKVGYFPCTQDPPHAANISRVLNEAMVEAQAAERAGFDSCLFSEHHQQPDGYIPNVLLLAGMAAMKTERLKVGTCVVLLALQHPVHVAEDCAIIDQMSRGRMILGVGVGYLQPDFSAFNIPIGERVGRTEEGLEIIRRCWAGERFSYRGSYHRLDDLSITPQPMQKPAPPIWMAAWTNAGLRRAGRLADGWISDPLQSLEVIDRFARLYRAESARHGRSPFVVLMRDVWLAESWEAARRESGPLMYTHRFYFRNRAYVQDRVLKDVSSEADWTFDAAAKERFIAGSAANCLEQLSQWRERIKPDYLILRMRHPGGPTHERAVQAIGDFGEQVIVHL